jgi:DNA mismatch repair protein MutL
MSKIRILPEQLANQIAAGEVIERPASVVKELVENSLDAGADRIEIEIEAGGTRLIRIIDNGEGMDEDDVLLSLERHGTSKIKDEKDLSTINSLGFRGEAIPSIASVSKMTITSRQANSSLGSTVICNYGRIQKVHESGAAAGTRVEISNLFGNTPARRKFLRTTRTELSHIDDTIKNYGLARPDVSFTLRINGRETIRFDHGMDVSRRLAQLLNYTGDFIQVDSGAPGRDSVLVIGLMVPPESSAPVAGRLRLFVNGRSIKDRMLIHAVNEGLRSFLLKGRSPTGFIKIELPPDSIDVNVHPAKHEVRFKDSRFVHQRVSETIREAMIRQQQLIRHDVFTTPEAMEPALSSYASPETRQPYAPVELGEDYPKRQTSPDIGVSHAAARHLPFTTRQIYSEPSAATSQVSQPKHPDPVKVQVDDLIVTGCFQDLYILCRNKDKLVVIDQHAAHERLLYEELKNQYTTGKIASQNLMFPVTLELTTFQSQLVEKNLEQLGTLGFSIRDFGGDTWIIAAVPAFAGTHNPQVMFLDILEHFGSERDQGSSHRLDEILSTMACKAAVKGGDQLNDPEIRALLERMADADLFSHCPHGRPVVKTFNSLDIKKWFSRT